MKKNHCQATCKSQKKCLNKNKETIYCNKHIKIAMPYIIKIQKWWKNIYPKLLIKKKGYGYYNRSICNNDDDFYSFEKISEIPNTFFVSYFEKETNKVWGYDIRSLYKLFTTHKHQPKYEDTHKTDKKSLYMNPYTTIYFSEAFIKKINDLCKNNINKNNDEYSHFEYEYLIHRQWIDILIEFNMFGYDIQEKWIFDLDDQNLIKLILELKDIIYYRAYLTHNQILEMFNSTYPFNYSIDILYESDKFKILELLYRELKKIMSIQNRPTQEHGILLFLTSLTMVNIDALNSFSYLVQ